MTIFMLQVLALDRIWPSRITHCLRSTRKVSAICGFFLYMCNSIPGFSFCSSQWCGTESNTFFEDYVYSIGSCFDPFLYMADMFAVSSPYGSRLRVVLSHPTVISSQSVHHTRVTCWVSSTLLVHYRLITKQLQRLPACFKA